MIEVGKRYYFAVHAYHHFVGEVVSIEGKRQCTLRNVCRVQGCGRPWSLFFLNGFKDDTNYTVWPDGTEVCDWMFKVPWSHDIPRTDKHVSTR